MSDEETKILSNEEKAKAPTTEPMLSAILARVNQIADDLGAFRAETGERFDALERRLHSLERRFDVFSIELSKIKGDVLDHENRVEELERKAS